MSAGNFFQRTNAHKKTVLVVLIVKIMMIWGCATLVDQELLDKPVVTFEGMTLENMSLFESTPVFSFKVSNPNPMSIKIRSIGYSFKINDKKFIKGVADKGIPLKAVGSEQVGLSVTFNYPGLFESVTEFIQSDKIAYDLSGFIGAGPFAIPYQTKGFIDIPGLPKISIKYVDTSNFSLTGTSTVIIVFSIENPNPFPIQLKGLNYSINLSETRFAKGSFKTVSPIAENSSSLVKIPMNVTFSELDWSLDNVLTKASSEYELSGKMKFYVPKMGKKNFPFHHTGNVSFIKEGTEMK